MTDVVLMHHIQGLTEGVQAFAEALREAGHTAYVPDLFDGCTFASIPEGQEFLGQVGFATVLARSVEAVQELPAEIVYAGFSLGVMPAQQLAQTRAGALGGLFYHSFAPPEEFGAWPQGLRAQIHAMDADPYFVDEGDLDAARPFLESHQDEAELFLYPGSGHLFTDRTLDDYDADASRLVLQRSLAFLDEVTPSR